MIRRVLRRVKHVVTRDKLTSWYLMGKRTNRLGFSWRRGSCASSGLIVAAVPVFATGASSSGKSGIPTMGLKTFSLSADAKSSFFAGESTILSALSADAACRRVSTDARVGKYPKNSVAYLFGGCQLESRHCVDKI
jgi:hypothetical protein